MKALLLGSLCAAAVGLTWCDSTIQAQDDKLKQAMSYRPFQKGVPYEREDGEDLSGLSLGNADSIGQVGFLVRDESDNILRRFVDSDGDKRLDTWAYYQRGVEVYRDVDTNQDTKPDTFFWLGPAGSRIGLDKDQDRVIESWAKISPQEVTVELVAALQEGDQQRLKALMLTSSELSGLKLPEDLERRITDRLKEAQTDLDQKMKEVKLPADAQWLHFGAPYPSAVATGPQSTVDVYDNVSALYETGGENRQLAVGSMIRVQDAWKLIDFPTLPSEGSRVVGGVFFQSSPAASANLASMETEAGVDVETLNAYQASEDAFRQQYGKVEGKALADLHAKRAKALMEVALSSKQDRTNWTRQYADIVSAAYQSGEFPDGLKELESQLEVMKDNQFDESLLAYAQYRALNAWYSRAAETADNLDDIQDQWQKRLNKFIDDYPKIDMAAEALFELGKIDDYLGDIDSAEDTYKKILANFPKTPFAARAKGAIVRLTSEGKSIAFQGQTVNGQPFSLDRLKGKMVLIHYWATWCEPCKDEFDELKDMYAKYRKAGFEVVSISLDESREDLMNYLAKEKDLSWIHLYAEGGMEESPLASQLGVIALPTMLLVDKDGTVLDRSATLQQVERELRKMK